MGLETRRILKSRYQRLGLTSDEEPKSDEFLEQRLIMEDFGNWV